MINLQEFKKKLVKNKRLIGLDVGRKTIGVALSDREKFIATPKFVLSRKSTDKDILFLRNYIIENDVCAIVVGLPLNSDEKEVKCCSYINNFIVRMSNLIDLPIYFKNEFLTSFEAEDTFIDKIGLLKTRSIVDKVAASIILQGVLNDLLID